MSAIRLALCLEYPLALRGGVSVLVEEFLRRLGSAFEIILVSPDTPEDLARHEFADRIAAHVRTDGRASRSSSRRLVAQLLVHRVQIAHFHFGGTYEWGIRFPGQSPIPALAKAGVAVCTTVHWVLPLLEGFCGPQKPFWFKLALFPVCWLSKLLVLRHLAAEIAVSRHDAALLRRWFFPCRARFRQIYHSRLESSAPPVRPPHEREKIILNVGHLAPRKGQHLLYAAFAQIAPQHPDWELHLAGPFVDGPYASGIKDAAERAGIGARVRLLGSRPDAVELMRSAAIYVQPSTGEALGLALQEALHAGCACIGARSGGIPELIDDEQNGLLVAPGSAEAIAEALERLLSDRETCERLALAAPESIQVRSMFASAMVAEHVELYESFLERA